MGNDDTESTVGDLVASCAAALTGVVELSTGEAAETKILWKDGPVKIEGRKGKTVVKVSELREFCSVWIRMKGV